MAWKFYPAIFSRSVLLSFSLSLLFAHQESMRIIEAAWPQNIIGLLSVAIYFSG